MMSKLTSILIALASVAVLATVGGCSTAASDTKAVAVDTGPVSFIDLDLFDSSLSKNMHGKSQRVTVNFPNQPVTVNDMPLRLQRWLSAVHKHGGGISVETREGYVQKDLIALMGIVMSGYKLAKQSLPTVLGRQYKAVIVLEDQNGAIDKVDFIRL